MFPDNRISDSLDLRENIAALALAVVSDRFLLPEQAFQKLDNHLQNKFSLEELDNVDMMIFKDQGMKTIDVAKIYGVDPSVVSRKVREQRKKTSLAGTR